MNNNWYYTKYHQGLSTCSKEDILHNSKQIRLPHIQEENDQETAYIYFLDMKTIKHTTISFKGIRGKAELFCNGLSLGTHNNPYTSFDVELNNLIVGENRLILKVKGCIYRSVELKTTEQSYLKDVFVNSDMNRIVTVEYTGIHTEGCQVAAEVADENGIYIASFPVEDYRDHISLQMLDALLWDQAHPHLYTLHLYLLKEGHLCDEHRIRFGFRSIEIRNTGVYLNSKKVRIRGVNRKPYYPLLNESVPKRTERTEADIIKREIGCNSVITADSIPSQDFLDRCDEIGLLVLPTVSDEETIIQYRNHPSIYMWNIEGSINAHQLDPTRPTTHIFDTKKAPLEEDVYAYNDHKYTTTHIGCESKSDITSDMNKPYLIASYEQSIITKNPLSHALRHAYVLNTIRSKKDIVGSYGPLMCDITQDNEGVMDAYRNPRLVSYFYATQGKKKAILEVRDHYIFTNCDYVEVYRNGSFVQKLTPSKDYAYLLHAPMHLEDPIGALLEPQLDHKQAEKLKSLIYAYDQYGSEIPLSIKLKMKVNHYTEEQLKTLCTKYLHTQEDTWEYRGYKKNKKVITYIQEPTTKTTLQVRTNTRKLVEGDQWDLASIRISYVDQNNHVLDINDPIHLEITGPGEIIGPHDLTVKEGMTGTYIKTIGQKGKIVLKLTSSHTKPVSLHITVI